MDREIKFRGKSIDENIWVYGYYVFCRGRHYILQKYNDKGYDERWEGSKWIEVNSESVGQYVGLKDKKGKEVYAGDIVQEINTENYAIINYINGCFKYDWFKINGQMRKPDSTPTKTYIDAIQSDYKMKVIGNKLENPELLKEAIDE